MNTFIPENLRQFVKIKENKFFDFTVFTYSVKGTTENGLLKGKKLILDDYTFKNYPELVDIIPRGFSVLYDNKTNKEICRLDGMKKFDGTSLLDDDSNVETHLIDYEKISKWETNNHLEVSFQEKANGKMAIFKVFDYQNEKFIFGGSKNVHKVYKLGDNIFSNDLASNILKLITKDPISTGQTTIGEYVDGRHMVYTNKPYMTYFNGPLCNVKDILPKQKVVPTKKQYQYIRNLTNTEGVVVVYKNTETGEIYRQKHKTVWYILIRVIREKLCRTINQSTDTSLLHLKVMDTIQKRSDDFLHLSVSDFEKWSTLVYKFIEYVKLNYLFTELSFTSHIGMGEVWHNFYTGTFRVQESYVEVPYQLNKKIQNLVDYGTELYNKNVKVCYIMQGVSGCGKSTQAEKMKDLYITDYSVFSTDTLFVNGFNPDKLTEYHDKNYQNFTESNSRVLCVDNTNLTFREYDRYIKNAKNRGYVTIILSFPKEDPLVLMNRSKHINNLTTISRMLKRYTQSKPVYYGIFVEKHKDFNVDQTTPLHITCSLRSSKVDETNFGKTIKIKVIGKSENIAGRCLIVEFDENLYLANGTKHITYETYENFKPVDVGKNIGVVTPLNFEITGVYGPIF
jgi:adenylate kinase family enzyme